jgi:6-phosphofructokinase 1
MTDSVPVLGGKLSKQLMEARVTILGYLQRGGTPSAGDLARQFLGLLATRLGTMCVELINDKVFGVMVAARGDGAKPVPIAEVAGRIKLVPGNHPWTATARRVGTSLGD